MIKMVVSDLDGTLLDKQNELSEDVRNMLNELKRNNILFTIASGRKLCELIKLFHEFKDDIIFIACDGAYATFEEKVIVTESIDSKILKRLTFPFETISDKSGCVFKIIVNSNEISEREKEYIKNNHLLTLIYDDFGIKEYIKYGINKGTALKQVLKTFNIDEKDVIAFGDNYNDKEMLKLISRSYAVKNAKNDIKQICKYRTDDVCSTIMQFIERV